MTDTKLRSSFSVEILDKNDERILNFNGPITLSLEDDPAGGTQISGDITVNAVNGVAVFNNVALNKKGLSFKLKASSGVATQVVSDAFNVAQKIYRSVGGNNTAPLSCGSTISGCIGTNESATFSNSQITFSGAITNNIGVGDVVVWDSNSSSSLNTGDSVVFIYKRISSTVYEVRTADGSLDSSSYSGTHWAIVRAYTSVSDAVDNTNGGSENSVLSSLVGATNANFDSYTGGKDLVTNNEQLNIAIYADTSTNTETTINAGWLTDDHRFLRIYTPYLPEEVGMSQRHMGYFDASKVLIDNTGLLNKAFVINTEYTVIEGLTLLGQSTVIQLSSGSENVEISNNIIQITSTSGSERFGIDLNSDSTGNFYVYNNVIYGNNSMSVGIYSQSATAFNAAIYNNTVYGLNEGLNNTAGSNFILKNNIFSNNNTDIQTCGCATSESNITSDATSPDDGSYDSVTLNFQNPSEGNFALDKTNDLEAIDQGADLSSDTYLKSSLDITNVQRGLASGWDIGAFESESLSLSDKLQTDFNYGTFVRTQSTGANTLTMTAYTESQRELQTGDTLFNSNLIGLWSGNGTLGTVADGTTLSDLSLSGNSITTVDGATDNTMSYVDGQLNEAIEFDGVDDYASTGNIDLPASYTVAFWYKNDNTAPNTTTSNPFSWNSSSGQGVRFNWGSSVTSGMQAWETDDVRLKYSTPLAISTWYHVAMTFSGGDLKIYLNGKLDKENNIPVPGDSGLESINLGAGSGGTAYFDDGVLDEVSVWDTALTSEQLKSLYEMQKASYVNSGEASFTSQVFEATSSSSYWWKLKPKPIAPYGKELPAVSETEYSTANVDMTNIVGIWHLNETHGTIYDSSGNNNHSTLVAGTPKYNQPGKLNGALNFDGTDDHVFFGTGPSMSGSTDFTVSMWLKTTKDGATAGQVGMSLVSQRDPGWDGGEYLINIGRNYNGGDPNPGKVLFVVWEDGGPQVNNFWSYRRVDDGNWHHLLVVREGLTLRIYIDGTLDREETGAGPLDTLDPSYYTVFGRDELFEDRYYEGALDEVAIWSRALSSSEVLNLYKRGALRIKYQVTNCDTPTCTDANFVGPDGSNLSFYSELSAQQSIIPNYSLYPLNSSRYFQYKVILESDDSSYTPELDDVYIFSQ